MALRKYFGGGKTEKQHQSGNAKSNKDDVIIDSDLEVNAINEALDDDFISGGDHEDMMLVMSFRRKRPSPMTKFLSQLVKAMEASTHQVVQKKMY